MDCPFCVFTMVHITYIYNVNHRTKTVKKKKQWGDITSEGKGKLEVILLLFFINFIYLPSLVLSFASHVPFPKTKKRHGDITFCSPEVGYHINNKDQ